MNKLRGTKGLKLSSRSARNEKAFAALPLRRYCKKRIPLGPDNIKVNISIPTAEITGAGHVVKKKITLWPRPAATEE
jgi:hypothetical protein